MTGNGHVRAITCSNCKLDLPETEFYRKGNRLESRCRKCVLARKKRISLEKKALLAKQKRRRIHTGVIDLSDFVVEVSRSTTDDAQLQPSLYTGLLEVLLCRSVL